jgi:CDP-diglyceride synthetase
MSHAAAWFVMALSAQFITVMYPAAMMNNENKEKPPCYTSTTTCMRILYLAFAEDAGLLITVFIICRYLMFSNPRKTSQSSA